MHNKLFVVCLLAFQGFFASMADASIVITGTRVIYQLPSRDVTVQLSSQNAAPVLVQGWIDDGDSKSSPDTVDTPFFVSPPIFRMDPQQGQSLRIAYVPSADKPLPADKESIFWLNVLEIPSDLPRGADEAEQARLNIAFRTRLKLFLRPPNLPGKANNAADALTWRFQGSDTQGLLLECNNPTAYHVTLIGIKAVVNGKEIHLKDDAMVKPGASFQFSVPDTKTNPGKTEIKFSFIDDAGAQYERTMQTTP